MTAKWVTGVETPNLKQPPISELSDFRTPLKNVFYLWHTHMPKIERAAWRLVVTGMVERELTLSLADLRAMPQTEVCAFHECAGHPLHPTVPVRRVANVVWQGVRLNDVLQQAGVKETANFLWSYGADGGDYHGVNIPSYVKDLPLPETQRDDVLLATHMNGEPLGDKHGGPVRLVVPGYYGTNSTKWLVRLELHDARSPGYFTTVMYNDRVVKDGRELIVPVWRVAPHAVMFHPAEGDRLPCAPQKILGWAWGADPITLVEISTDNGLSWTKAHLSEREGHAWQRFEFDWEPLSPGQHELRCRATDCAGVGQPREGARNAIFSIAVTVE